MPGLKKCYYEVIGVERKATDDEIKKAFRRLALQLHPDKNPDRADEAKAEFQILQQAYEVLSNPQERAWYDKHRQAVLREGVDRDYDDFNIDLMAYCTSTCYSGFGDDEGCFYTVYREVFSKLTAEEVEAGWSEENEEDIPSFGDSQSLYDDVVGPFYAFWESFCTLKSFTWNDEYDTRHAGCRRVARLMDKENKKIRTDARKAWNREVRALVDFVKRKDKRVQAWKATQDAKLKEKEAELAKKADEAKAQRLAERKKILDSVKKNKTQPENQQVLKEMEQWMSNEFGEPVSDKESDEEDPTCFHCAACNKSFRSEKAFSNHEKSKKHLSQVQKLREMMEEEDNMFEQSSHEEEEENGTEEEIHLEDGDVEENGIDENDVNEGEEKVQGDLEEATNHLEILNVNGSVKSIPDNESAEESDHEKNDELIEQEFLARAAAKKGRRRQISINDDAINELSDSHIEKSVINPASSEDEKAKEKADKRKKRKDKRQARKVTDFSDTADTPMKIQESKETAEALLSGVAICVVCKMEFESRSKMFSHIKSTGHAAPLETIKTMKAEASFDAGKSNKKRRGKQREL